jgi:hypothetical protein
MKRMPNEYALSKRTIDEAFNDARQMLANEGGVVEESPHDYQCFTFKTDDVCLVFYPHRTTAQNYHIRVRNHGSKNRAKADKLMDILDEGAGYNCKFSRKI